MTTHNTFLSGGGTAQRAIGNRWALGGFVIATAILGFVGWQSHRSTGLLVDAAQWREHTYEVLNSLDETVGLLSDAETGQRGYCSRETRPTSTRTMQP
jgi:CHASE3 domain sensor protein